MAIGFCNLLWRLLIAAVFLLAAWGKYQTPPAARAQAQAQTVYADIVGQSQVLHWGLIASELAVALWLLSGRRARRAGLAAGLMLLGFTTLLAYELHKPAPSACGCGIRPLLPGQDPVRDLLLGMGRNAILLLGCGWLIAFGDERLSGVSGDASPEHRSQGQ